MQSQMCHITVDQLTNEIPIFHCCKNVIIYVSDQNYQTTELTHIPRTNFDIFFGCTAFHCKILGLASFESFFSILHIPLKMIVSIDIVSVGTMCLSLVLKCVLLAKPSNWLHPTPFHGQNVIANTVES